MLDLLAQALQVTTFVGVMMIAVEYLGVSLRGAAWRGLAAAGWRSYALAALLGAVPGCLGAFAVVALYVHRRLSLGAVVACMIATSGDEAFVMLALFPGRALAMTAGLALVGVVAGAVTDRVSGNATRPGACSEMVVHDADACRCFEPAEIFRHLLRPTASRLALAVALVAFSAAVASGALGPARWNWVRVTLLASSGFGLFVVTTVPDHFLEEHLWRHVALRHVPRIFAWTLAALFVAVVLRGAIPGAIPPGAGRWMLLGTAALLGIVPESGPHLVFVTMFAQGIAPASVLVTSSIVQDGHGMLPLLAASRRDFLVVKGVNLVVGVAVGSAMMASGA